MANRLMFYGWVSFEVAHPPIMAIWRRVLACACRTIHTFWSWLPYMPQRCAFRHYVANISYICTLLNGLFRFKHCPFASAPRYIFYQQLQWIYCFAERRGVNISSIATFPNSANAAVNGKVRIGARKSSISLQFCESTFRITTKRTWLSKCDDISCDSIYQLRHRGSFAAKETFLNSDRAKPSLQQTSRQWRWDHYIFYLKIGILSTIRRKYQLISTRKQSKICWISFKCIQLGDAFVCEWRGS